MDENIFKKFLEGTGTIAESGLIFYRILINSGATREEATDLTTAFFISLLNFAREKG